MASLSSTTLKVPRGKDVYDFFFEEGYTDGLPIVPPTRHRVLGLLTGTERAPGESLGRCAPDFAPVTVEKLAIAGVMAGCRAEHMAVLVAAAEAMLDPDFNLHGVHATTMGATPCVLVSGPVRDRIGMNYSAGALNGTSSRANASIGRALKLLLQNVGGAKLGGTEATTLGTPMKVGMCVAEDEARAHAWEPYHQLRGLPADASAVTVLAVTSGPYQITDLTTRDASKLIRLFGQMMASAYSPQVPLINDALVVVSPEHHASLLAGGIRSKADFQRRLWTACNRATAGAVAGMVQLGKPGLLGFVLGHILQVLALLANLLRLPPLVGVPPLPAKFASPSSFHVIVAGGSGGKFTSFCPGFGTSAHSAFVTTRPVTKLVSEPARPPPGASPHPGGEADQALLNPTAERAPAAPLQRPLRAGGDGGGFRRGDVVGLFDIAKPCGQQFLARLERRIHAACPEVLIRRFSKPTFSKVCPEAVRRAVLGACTHVICALAD